MNSSRTYGATVLAALLLVVAHVLLVPAPASASAGAPLPTVPAGLEIPAPYVLRFSRHAKGVQTYECQAGAWTFRAPKAVLLHPDDYQLAGIHYGGIDRGLTPGPWWESLADGSRIRGGNPVSAPSPNANSIPLLRLEVLEHDGTGEFSPIRYIHRLNTVGGVSPTGACTTGAKRWVPYTADYYFYGTP
jgi:hypothetical protein